MAPRLPDRLPRALVLWGAAALLLTLGLLTTLLDLSTAPGKELRAANANGQRVIIDPVTGTVSGIVATATDDSFEVSEDDAAPATDDDAAPAPAATSDATVADPAPAIPQASQATVPSDLPALRTARDATELPNIAASRDSLVAPQAPEITELVKNGAPLPKRGDKDSTPSYLYAKHFTRDKKMAYVSIVITDAGFNTATTAQILGLPQEVSVAFSPYATDAKTQIALLHTAGVETWGMLPAMGARYPQDDPGPLGLINGMPMGEQIDRLHDAMASTLGAVGLVLPPDEAITPQDDFAKLLGEIDGRGLFLLSTHPSRSLDQITKDAAIQHHIQRADIVLDSTASVAFIKSKLAGLKGLAEKQRMLIVVASARPQTLSLLADWLKTDPLGATVQLAPLSAMYTPATPSAASVAEEKPAHGGGH